jgi:hypothetical protein
MGASASAVGAADAVVIDHDVKATLAGDGQK